jgi:hypothetical protein
LIRSSIWSASAVFAGSFPRRGKVGMGARCKERGALTPALSQRERG